MKDKVIYFSGLNGLRAIAALAVVVSHITLALKEFNLDPFIFGTFKDGTPKGLSLAGYGVSIFFVLSGFLITYLLQAEKDIQSIDVKKFYVRRILRIWPLYYLYLLISVIVILMVGLELDLKSLFLYFFYAANVPFILGTGLPFLEHYWSLGVEEQFYLFWPWFNKKINNFIVPIIGFFIAILLGTKVCLHFFYPNTVLELAITISRFHCMMIGAIGAILFKKENKLFLKITDNRISQYICWLIILLVAINKFHFASIIDNEIICIVALVLIIGQINIKNRIVNLEINVLDYLGKISYGIYVIHPLLIFLFSQFLNKVNLKAPYKYLFVYTVILATTILISHVSYSYFEKYFLKLKGKFVVVGSAATKHFNS